ncbi:MAG TPA: hypothetical protein GX733_07035 [Tissierellia bacterium]|nr:hypothetical protein [Tissierellia bacterium]
MKIEILYPEIANLFGEIGHQMFLQLLFPKAQIIRTQLLARPTFLDEQVDLIFMGPTSENSQEKIIQVLRPLKEKIEERIHAGDRFFFTGNAMEVLGTSILTDEGRSIQGLGIFEMESRRQMMHRLTELYVGMYDDLQVVGTKTQFTQNYPLDPETFPYLMKTVRGFGMNKQLEGEGIHFHHFVGTYVLGPLLILNPLFTERLFEEWGIPVTLPHRNTLLEAYDIRLKGYLNPKSYA